jgi:hypothetical protein
MPVSLDYKPSGVGSAEFEIVLRVLSWRFIDRPISRLVLISMKFTMYSILARGRYLFRLNR